MTNKEFVKKYAEKYGVTQVSFNKYLDILELAMKEELAILPEDSKLKVLDFTFEVKNVPSRVMRNPKTGEEVITKPIKKLRVRQSSDWQRIFKDI